MHNVVRTACLLALIGVSYAPNAHAAEPIHNYIPGAKMVGQGRAQMLFWDVYDAKLYAPKGVYTQGQSLALELSYLQTIDGHKIASHATGEMRRLGYKNETKLNEWRISMSRIFPNVSPGSTLIGIHTQGGPTMFYEGTRKLGQIDDVEFGREFFRIWLDARTSQPALRQSLITPKAHSKGPDYALPDQNSASGGNHAS